MAEASEERAVRRRDVMLVASTISVTCLLAGTWFAVYNRVGNIEATQAEQNRLLRTVIRSLHALEVKNGMPLTEDEGK